MTDTSQIKKEQPPTVKTVADDIETYKTMLWVQSKIDTGADCRPLKQALDAAYIKRLNEYERCFEKGLYYYYHRLPFLNEGGFTDKVSRFRERLVELEIKHKYVEEAQRRLGFPAPRITNIRTYAYLPV